MGMDKSTFATQLNIKANQELTEEQIRSALAASQFSDAQKAQITTILMGKNAVQGYASSLKVMALNLRASLSSLLTSPTAIISLVTTAFTFILGKIEEARQRQSELRQETIQNAQAAADEAKEIATLTARYLDLSNAVEAGTASSQELLDSRDELISSLGLEKDRLRELILEYGNYREALIAASKEKLGGNLSDLLLGYDAAVEEAEASMKDLHGDPLAEVAKYTFLRSLFVAPPKPPAKDIPLISGSAEEAIPQLEKLRAEMEARRSEFGDDDSLYREMNERYTEYSSILSPLLDMSDEVNQTLAAFSISSKQLEFDPSSYEEFLQFRDELISSLEENPDFKTGRNSAEWYIDEAIRESGEQYQTWLSQLETQEAQAAEIQSKRNEILSNIIVPAPDAGDGRLSSAFSGISDFVQEAKQVEDRVNALSDEDLEIAYKLVIEEGYTTWEDLRKAIDEYNSAQNAAARNSDQLRARLGTLWDSEDFADTRTELEALADAAGGITPDSIAELAEESETLAELLDVDGMNARFLSHILQEMATGNDGLSLITEDALKLNQALDGMVSRFDEVSAAKAGYDNAMSQDEKDTDFRSYAEAFASLNEEFERGTTNSNAFWAAAEYLFGNDQLAAWGWADGLDEIYQAMQRNSSVFQDADSAGAGFIQRLYEMAEAGELVNENGEKLLEISRDADGAYVLDIDPDNLAEIAAKMGMTEEAALACFKALSMYGEINFYDIKEVADVLAEIGLSAESAGRQVINLTALTEQLSALKMTGKEISDITSRLEEYGAILLDTSGDVDAVTQSLTALGLAAEKDTTIQVNSDGLAALLSQMQFTKEQAAELIAKLGEADGITLTNAAGEVQSVSAALQYLDGLDFALVTEGANELTDAVGALNDSPTGKVTAGITAVGDAAGDAANKVRSVANEVTQLNGRRATVTIDVQRQSSLYALPRFAKGTDQAPEGKALVGDEYSPTGRPKPELVVSQGKAYLAGVHGPEIVDLQRGDQVYPADETRRILKGPGKRISGIIPAYAGGRISSGGLNVGGNYGNSGNTGHSGNSGQSVTVTPEVDNSQVEEAMEDTLDKLKEELDDIIGNFEHSIFLLERNHGSVDEIIAAYRQMQDAVHRQAEKYRQMGLDENSDYIQDLQQQWWEYNDSIQAAMEQHFADIRSGYENAIAFNQTLLDNATANRDISGVEHHANDIVDGYKALQETIHRQAEYYRSLGYAETSDEVSELANLWWDYANTIQEVKQSVVDHLMDIVADTSQAIDDIQNVYDTLKDAANEYAENGGFISVDAFQAIIDLGPEYMQYLRDENGLLKINEESINRVIAAKTEQLALDSAMNYVERLRLALQSNSIEDLNQLLLATTDSTKATWGLVYANLALLDLNSDQYQAALHNINAIRDLANTAISGIGQASGGLNESLNDMQSGVNDILQYVMDMLKQRIEDQVDALEEMKDSYSNIIALKKESLEASKEEADYQKTLSDKTREIAALQAKIDALSLDDSRAAQAERAALLEELRALQEDLADTQAEKALTSQTEALDKMEEAYAAEKDKEIQTLKDSISSYQKLYDMAISYINEHWDSLYAELIGWNTEYGSSLNTEIQTAWENCLAAAERYGSYVAALEGVGADIGGSGTSDSGGNNTTVGGAGSGHGEYSDRDMVSAIVEQMRRLGQQWDGSGNTESKNRQLHEQAAALAARLPQYGVTAEYDPATGIWWIREDLLNPSNIGKRLHDCYHQGGIVGGGGVKANEQIALLKKDEWVLSEAMVKNLQTQIGRIAQLSRAFDGIPGYIGKAVPVDGVHAGVGNTINNITNHNSGGAVEIRFGDTNIYGADEVAAKRHVEINRDMANQLARLLKMKF